MENTIKIDLDDLDAMREVMDKYHTHETMLIGRNDEDEMTATAIFEDRIVHETYQANGWVRMNVLHRDGTAEELFKGKWN